MADKHQLESFLDDCKEAFFPEELLIENLQQDELLSSSSAQTCCYSVGNRLEGMKNGEGTLQLFFPVGQNTDRVGSCIFFPESNTPAWSSEKHCGDSNRELPYSMSTSVRQPILQIAADKIESSWDDDECRHIPLAARTLYQVHWLTSQIQDGYTTFTSEGVENFQYGTSNVVWNPHLLGEAAVILGNGDMMVFDLKAKQSHVPSSIMKMEECMGNGASSCSTHTLWHRQKKRKERGRELGSLSSAHPRLTQKWWSCEYGWHPKNLLVAGQTEICLIDLRQKFGSNKFQCSVASISRPSKLFSYCNQMHRTDNFTALTRADHDGMFQFAAASTNHLMLYDIRQPSAPLLQWEHRMQLEPPRLLQIYRFSDLCPSFLKTVDTPLAAGRAILACTYRSGDMHAFCYGPDPRAHLSNSEGFKSELLMDGVGLTEKLYSWELPIKLTNCYKNLEHDFEPHENMWQSLFRKDHEVEQLAGLFNFSTNEGASSFMMVQLTGSGLILSRKVQISKQWRLENHELLGTLSQQQVSPVKTTSGNGRTKHYRMEPLPAFLNHMQFGSVVHKCKQNVYSSSSAYGNAMPSNNEHQIELRDESQKPEDSTAFHKETETFRECSNDSMLRSLQNKNECQNPDENPDAKVFFNAMANELCPITLSFEDLGGINSHSEGLVLLTGLKDLFQQWQQDFQPYIVHRNSDVYKEH